VSEDIMNKKNTQPTQFVVCVRNGNYLASLEVRKVYQALPDPEAEKHQLIRVVDESGEDYLYPMDYFVYVELPQEVEKIFSINA
jgi:hypothetical protein